jgi:hypothetical protein
MNLNVYSEAAGNEAPQEITYPANAKEKLLQGQHQEWLRHPNTVSLIESLSQEKQKLTDTAISKACSSDPNVSDIVKHLVSANQIQKTLESIYGRGK